MAKRKVRRIVIDGENYLWRFVPGYEQTGSPGNPYQCHDIFTAYLEGYKASPLQIHFTTWEDAVIGGPLRTGAPINLNDPNSAQFNLHAPKDAAETIRQALKLGWQPKTTSIPFVIKNGSQLLSNFVGT